MKPLPQPSGPRWQPMRIGLKNIYRYDDEQFLFSGGRLLLRGNNGTGKTRVIALTLPFLLDGEVRPARVEPDGNPNRRIEWHLLMDQWHERIGYTWIEFGRMEGDQPRYCTLGCGMRAVEGRTGLHSRWFFVSSARIDDGLTLAEAGGSPLSRERLKEIMEGHGTVYDTADTYRRAVDDTLFGLGERRYKALVDLLIELRRPQLSRELDEAVLSAALSNALSPLEQTVLDDVAEGYRELERDREGLQAVETAAEAVAAFNQIHHREVAMHAGRLADAVRSTHEHYDSAQRAVRAAQEARIRAEADLEVANKRLAVADNEREKADGIARALLASPEMRTAQRLDRLRMDTQRATNRAENDANEANRRDVEAHALTSELFDAEKRNAAARNALLDSANATRAAGSAIGVPHRDGEEPAAHRQRLLDESRARREAAKRLANLDESVRRERSHCDQADLRVRDAETRRDAALRSAEEADEQVIRARQAFLAAVYAHIASLTECRIDADAVKEALALWLNEPEEVDPLSMALATAAPARLCALADDRAAQVHARGLLQQERESLATEATRLRAGVDPGPPSPKCRDDSLRRDRSGAPLWRVVDFDPEIIDADRAGYEAALQASGLLDAWLYPDGRLEIRPDGDVYLDASAVARDGLGLGAVLVPSIDPSDIRAAQLDAGIIARALSTIGSHSDDGSCWVAADGTWRNGPARGTWMKSAAEHLGAGARAAARRARLVVIAGDIERIDSGLAMIAAAIQTIDAAVMRTQAEESSAPDADDIRQPWHLSQLRARHLAEARAEVASRQTDAAARAADLARARDERKVFATDCGLAGWIDRSGELSDALAALDVALHKLAHALTSVAERGAELGRAVLRANHAKSAAEQAAARARDSAGDASALTAELTELQTTQGSAVTELLRRLDEVRSRGEIANAERKAAEIASGEAREAIGSAKGSESEARTRLDETAVERSRRIQSLREIAAEGLLAIIGESFRTPTPLDAADTRILDLARALAREVGNLQRDDAAVDRLQSQVGDAFQDLHRTLSSVNMLPIGDVRHGLHLVRVPFQGHNRGTAELQSLLQEDASARRQLLTANERTVIENFLLDEAAGHLHGLLHEAEKWVVTVNRELENRPMSTGMMLRFRWLPDEEAPEGTVEARARLLRPSHAWSADDREGLAAFLQRRISASREDAPGATWQEQLAIALDYRRWHRFVIDRRDHAGRWVRLTKRTHGTGSGGEKAVALTMPQFAAAAAHYHGSPHAPRLILLDEAFVGIDNDMRRQCLGLLSAFDLDVVMTSEREWGCYDTVPSLAIYQLASDPGSNCIATTRYVWDGRQRVRDDQQS